MCVCWCSQVVELKLLVCWWCLQVAQLMQRKASPPPSPGRSHRQAGRSAPARQPPSKARGLGDAPQNCSSPARPLLTRPIPTPLGPSWGGPPQPPQPTQPCLSSSTASSMPEWSHSGMPKKQPPGALGSEGIGTDLAARAADLGVTVAKENVPPFTPVLPYPVPAVSIRQSVNGELPASPPPAPRPPKQVSSSPASPVPCPRSRLPTTLASHKHKMLL